MQELYNYDARWEVAKRYEEVMALIKNGHRKASKYYPEKKLMFHLIHHNKKLHNAGALKQSRV